MRRTCSLLTVTVWLGLLLGGCSPTSSDPKARCRDGIRSAFPTFIAAADKVIGDCVTKVARQALSADCGADALLEFDSTTATAGHGGKLRREADRFRAALLGACAGADGVPYTADDVTAEDLDPGDHSGFRLLPWGAALAGRTEAVRLTQLRDQPAFTSDMQDIIEEECITKEPVDAWMAKPPLQRLLDTYQCLGINESLRKARAGGSIVAPTVQMMKFDITKPPVVYDGGADLVPVSGPDGVNDSINFPATSGCPLPGVGVCAGNTDVVCSLRPHSGKEAKNADCGAAGPCVERLIGPDGVTSADRPHGRLADGRFIYKLVQDATRREIEIEFMCLVQGVTDASGTLVTTSFSGTCVGGPHADEPCKSAVDCDAQSPPRFFCLDGDEYFCHMKEVIGSNRDNNPPCGGPCLVAQRFGPPGVGCGKGGDGYCAIGVCAGGKRAGQACDGDGNLKCPGGECRGPGDELTLTGDEAGFYIPNSAGMGYALCPFQMRHDLPLDLLAGNGWARAKLTDAPLYSCRPPGTAAQFEPGYVHEPGANGRNSIQLIGMYAGSPDGKFGTLPCPSIGIPLPETLTGLPTRTGVGPIIGVTGTHMP